MTTPPQYSCVASKNADNLFQRARVEVLPTFDIFYKGNRVARVDGPRFSEVETVVNQYQLLNSDLDLFSESANDVVDVNSNSGRPQPSPWGQGSGGSSQVDFTKTPRTTASFIPGYDWNKKGGFFDELAMMCRRIVSLTGTTAGVCCCIVIFMFRPQHLGRHCQSGHVWNSTDADKSKVQSWQSHDVSILKA